MRVGFRSPRAVSGSLHNRCVFPLSDALAMTRQIRPLLAGTGSADLDSLTGGIRGGQLWVITGAPGAGKTTLACQIAAHAVDGATVGFLAGIEGIGVAVQVEACATGLSAWEVRSGSAGERAGRMGSDTTGSSQDIRFGDRESTTLGEVLSLPEPKLIVVDDIDLWLLDQLTATQLVKTRCLQAGSAAVVTAPEHTVGPRAPQWQAWVRVAHVIVSVEPDSMERPGIAVLNVLHHRSGPKARIEVVYEPWRGRLGDLSEALKSANR